MQEIIQTVPGEGQTPAPDYENKKQLAARLGVSVRTIDNLLTRGLPHLKLTRKSDASSTWATTAPRESVLDGTGSVKSFAELIPPTDRGKK